MAASDIAGLEHATRDAIWELLSERDLGHMSRRDGGSELIEGDEYVDLGHLQGGVRRMEGPSPATGELLPRNALEGATWSRICARLVPPHVSR